MISRQSTAELLAASLKELARFKSVDKITIKELTRNCGLTSPTFYNHFRDKYELMAWIYNREIEVSLEGFGRGDSFEDVVRKWIEILLEDESFYLNLLKNAVGQNSFRYAANDHAIKLLEDWLRARQDLSDEQSWCLRFYMRAISETINDWFLGRCFLKSHELSRLLVEWMPAPLKPLLLQV